MSNLSKRMAVTSRCACKPARDPIPAARTNNWPVWYWRDWDLESRLHQTSDLSWQFLKFVNEKVIICREPFLLMSQAHDTSNFSVDLTGTDLFYICGSCCKQFFLCASVFPQTLYFSLVCMQFISVFTTSANSLFQNFLTFPVKKIMFRP